MTVERSTYSPRKLAREEVVRTGCASRTHGTGAAKRRERRARGRGRRGSRGARGVGSSRGRRGRLFTASLVDLDGVVVVACEVIVRNATAGSGARRRRTAARLAVLSACTSRAEIDPTANAEASGWVVGRRIRRRRRSRRKRRSDTGGGERRGDLRRAHSRVDEGRCKSGNLSRRTS